MSERENDLKREMRVLTAWIRDVTAKKQARLREIQRELAVLMDQNGGNSVGAVSGAR